MKIITGCIALLGLTASAAGCSSDDIKDDDRGSGRSVIAPTVVNDDGSVTTTAALGATEGGGLSGGVIDTSGGAAGGGPDSFEACTGQSVGTELLPPVLELVVDTSLSMDEMAPGSTESKWIETRAALLTAIDALPSDVSVGLIFYPDMPLDNGGGGGCFDEEADVAIGLLAEAASAQRTTLSDALNTQTPDGATPTHDAYVYALDQLDTEAPGGNRFVVLITDGVPTYTENCGQLDINGVDPTPIINEAEAAYTTGVKTFVIGSPGSEEARDSLSRIASVGGTAQDGCSDAGPNYCHFDMTSSPDFGAALTQALQAISEQVLLGCTYDIPSPTNGEAIDRDRVNVTLTLPDGTVQEIGKDPSEAECNTGWQYAPGGDQILLCGDTCTQVEQATGTLSLEFGCLTRLQ